MKKIICLLVVLSFLSCSTNQSINDYLEIENMKSKNSYCVLASEKTLNSQTLQVYLGNRMQRDSKPKYSNVEDYNYLKQEYKNDTLKEFWNKNELKNFKYQSSTWDEYLNHIEKLNDSKIDSETYYYSISKPLHIKNKKIVIFYLSKRRTYRQPIDDFVVIMKKEKGKYIVLEKIHNTALY
jgi:hypothetical protein